ncbi:ROK family transcriptional regulator [Actinomadura barringtoniae]|uniref:ROK family transcriptional regulator n=1 Tax=Actinomadura barringtoniae TaxID=1427535 RepID=A0A939T1X0_9ACTN|nr:ROK family protein [Actinomadura barringtoniae]MBO2445553.1 ROK family transcriptional regulator [Actinomadura barringtoniae]
MTGATTSSELRQHNLLRVLRAVHDGEARITRSELTRDLELARGTAAVLVGDLVNARLIREEPAPEPQRTRGRPTAVPGPHPDGPLAIAVDLREDAWTIAAAELGGRLTVLEDRPHDENPAADVLAELAAAVRRHRADLAPRTVGVAVAAPGPVREGRLLDIPHLDWRDVDAVAALDGALLDNDATVAGLAEARRGALRDASLGLHLHIEFDLGGTLVVAGNPLPGARGTSGEFGHMPLTGTDVACACGATGCWGVEVGGNALLRAAGLPVHDHARALQVLKENKAAVDEVAAPLGVGISALVNALDPGVVTLSGMGPGILDMSMDEVQKTYLPGLMTFRREQPPAIIPSALGTKATLIGAAERVFDAFLTPEGLTTWHNRANTTV